jgi:hypothetical protein
MNARALLLVLALSTPALAYLDPVTGNLLVQAVLAGLAAIALGYHRLKAYLGSLFGKKTESEPKSEEKPSEQPLEDKPSEANASADASQPDNDQAAV